VPHNRCIIVIITPPQGVIADRLLDFTAEEAQVWGRLRVPHCENPLDKQIAATALIYGLILVTRNVSDFEDSGIELINPFE
jgi:predicted nucleic acid-binding protein